MAGDDAGVRRAGEQLRGEPASVASDIWSLGVLYCSRLLSNQHFATEDGSAADTASIPPADRAASTVTGPDQREPITARSLRGDLDAIVARAMEQEPGRRSPVDALAEDLRQHLDAQPVKARHGNWAYRSGCFLRRYRLPVAITLVAVLALAVTLLYALSAARRAQLEADRASLVKRYLNRVLQIGNPDRGGQGQVNAGTLLVSYDRALSASSVVIRCCASIWHAALRNWPVRSATAAAFARLMPHWQGTRGSTTVSAPNCCWIAVNCSATRRVRKRRWPISMPLRH